MVGGKTLNARKLLAALYVAAGLIHSAEVLPNRVPGATVTGHVSAASNGDWISVDGKTYRIKSGSPAASAAAKLTPGEYVDIQLDGPANTAASEVINVVRHTGQ
jgi:hypothetical protein